MNSLLLWAGLHDSLPHLENPGGGGCWNYLHLGSQETQGSLPLLDMPFSKEGAYKVFQ